jgi:glycerophosphoryl diester phosphodiesterase
LVPVVPDVTRALKRVGHKGAALISPGNTVASFQAALSANVDMIEFDLIRLRDGRIVFAHDFDDAARREPLTLDEGFDHLAGADYAAVELDIDMKLPGFEREVVEAIERRGLADRTLISSHYIESLDECARLAPGIRRGLSVPRVRRNYLRSPLAVPAYAVGRYMRARLPVKMGALMDAGRIQAVMAHWMLVSRRLVEVVHARGGEVYVWTVDDARHIERLHALGVHGVITNDPRLFGKPSRALR